MADSTCFPAGRERRIVDRRHGDLHDGRRGVFAVLGVIVGALDVVSDGAIRSRPRSAAAVTPLKAAARSSARCSFAASPRERRCGSRGARSRYPGARVPSSRGKWSSDRRSRPRCRAMRSPDSSSTPQARSLSPGCASRPAHAGANLGAGRVRRFASASHSAPMPPLRLRQCARFAAGGLGRQPIQQRQDRARRARPEIGAQHRIESQRALQRGDSKFSSSRS
jgi:hypothetical protein